jgi:hypothetical protein
VAYPVEPLGQDVEEEAADELVGGERQGLVTVFFRRRSSCREFG